jgi:hypothetical protein
LPRSDVEGHALPTPRVDPQPKGDKSLDARVRGHASFRSVAANLTTHDVVHGQVRNRFEDFHLLVANRLAVGPHRRFHCQIAQNLEQVILNHIPQSAGLLVKRAAPLHAKIFRHRDLHTLHAIPVPERLHERVGEPEKQHVVRRSLAQVMINTEDPSLIEAGEQRAVERSRGREVTAEGFLDDHRAVGAAGVL